MNTEVQQIELNKLPVQSISILDVVNHVDDLSKHLAEWLQVNNIEDSYTMFEVLDGLLLDGTINTDQWAILTSESVFHFTESKSWTPKQNKIEPMERAVNEHDVCHMVIHEGQQTAERLRRGNAVLRLLLKILVVIILVLVYTIWTTRAQVAEMKLSHGEDLIETMQFMNQECDKRLQFIQWKQKQSAVVSGLLTDGSGDLSTVSSTIQARYNTNQVGNMIRLTADVLSVMVIGAMMKRVGSYLVG
jgi:hypothetical protein